MKITNYIKKGIQKLTFISYNEYNIARRKTKFNTILSECKITLQTTKVAQQLGSRYQKWNTESKQ